MSNRGKIEKIKSIIKKWQNYGKIGRSRSGLGSSNHTDDSCDFGDQDEQNFEVPAGHRTVYVGKSRRRYVVSENHLNHPLLKVLIEKSHEGPCGADLSGETISCEVVLFEHLLWMLKNADPEAIKSECLEELVEFYAS